MAGTPLVHEFTPYSALSRSFFYGNAKLVHERPPNQPPTPIRRNPTPAQAIAATCAVEWSNPVDIDSISARRKQTQTVAMIIICHMATR